MLENPHICRCSSDCFNCNPRKTMLKILTRKIFKTTQHRGHLTLISVPSMCFSFNFFLTGRPPSPPGPSPFGQRQWPVLWMRLASKGRSPALPPSPTPCTPYPQLVDVTPAANEHNSACSSLPDAQGLLVCSMGLCMEKLPEGVNDECGIGGLGVLSLSLVGSPSQL